MNGWIREQIGHTRAPQLLHVVSRVGTGHISEVPAASPETVCLRVLVTPQWLAVLELHQAHGFFDARAPVLVVVLAVLRVAQVSRATLSDLLRSCATTSCSPRCADRVQEQARDAEASRKEVRNDNVPV